MTGALQPRFSLSTNGVTIMAKNQPNQAEGLPTADQEAEIKAAADAQAAAGGKPKKFVVTSKWRSASGRMTDGKSGTVFSRNAPSLGDPKNDQWLKSQIDAGYIEEWKG